MVKLAIACRAELTLVPIPPPLCLFSSSSHSWTNFFFPLVMVHVVKDSISIPTPSTLSSPVHSLKTIFFYYASSHCLVVPQVNFNLLIISFTQTTNPNQVLITFPFPKPIQSSLDSSCIPLKQLHSLKKIVE